MRAILVGQTNCSHNMSRTVKRIRRLSERILGVRKGFKKSPFFLGVFLAFYPKRKERKDREGLLGEQVTVETYP